MPPRPRAPEVLLAGLTALETVRGVAPELLVVLGSVVVNVGIDDPIVVVALNGGFLFVAFYVFTPLVFPASLGERRERPGFRLVVGVVSLAYALPTTLALTAFESFDPSYTLVGAYLGTATLGGVGAFALYFHYTQSAPLAAPGGAASSIVQRRSDESPAESRRFLEDLQAERPRVALSYRVLSVGASMATFVGPCLIFGLVAATLDSLFPLLEAVVVAGLLLRAGDRVGLDPSVEVPDMEARFYDRLTAATRSTRGTAGVMMVACALVYAVFLVALWIRIDGLSPGPIVDAYTRFESVVAGQAGVRSIASRFAGFVAAVGGLLAVPVSSGYAAWYWLRTLRRLAAFEAGDESPVAGPPWLSLPATALALAWGGYLLRFRFDVPVEVGFAIVWPVLLVAIGWTVRRTTDANPDQPGEVSWSLPLAFVLYAGGLSLVLIGPFHVLSRILLPAVFLPWMFYLDDVTELSDGLFGRVLPVGYAVVLLSVLLALQDVLNVSTTTLAVVAGAAALLVLGQILTYVYEDGAF